MLSKINTFSKEIQGDILFAIGYNLAEKYEGFYDCVSGNKDSGNSIGSVVHINSLDDPDFCKAIYYVKAHSGVRVDGKLQLSELFLYKMLEHIGYGPKCEFILDDESATVFIATRYAAHTKNEDKQKQFHTMKDVDENLILDRETCDGTDLVVIDFLLHLFRMHDVCRIPDNYGVIKVKQDNATRYKWQIIDFNPPDVEDFKCIKGMDLGKHTVAYYDTKFMDDVLSRHARQETTLQKVYDIMMHGKIKNNGERKMHLEEAMQDAKSDVLKFVEDMNKLYNQEIFKKEWILKEEKTINGYIASVEVAMGKWKEFMEKKIIQNNELNSSNATIQSLQKIPIDIQL